MYQIQKVFKKQINKKNIKKVKNSIAKVEKKKTENV